MKISSNLVAFSKNTNFTCGSDEKIPMKCVQGQSPRTANSHHSLEKNIKQIIFCEKNFWSIVTKIRTKSQLCTIKSMLTSDIRNVFGMISFSVWFSLFWLKKVQIGAEIYNFYVTELFRR